MTVGAAVASHHHHQNNTMWQGSGCTVQRQPSQQDWCPGAPHLLPDSCLLFCWTHPSDSQLFCPTRASTTHSCRHWNTKVACLMEASFCSGTLAQGIPSDRILLFVAQIANISTAKSVKYRHLRTSFFQHQEKPCSKQAANSGQHK